jgi:hypothetical protein
LHLLFFHSSILTFSWLKPQTFSNLCSSVNCFSDLVSSHTACVVFLFQFMHVSNTWGVALLSGIYPTRFFLQAIYISITKCNQPWWYFNTDINCTCYSFTRLFLLFSWLKPQTFSNLCSSVNCFSDLVSCHTTCVTFLFQFMHVSNTWGVALLIRYICVVVFSKYWSKIWIVPKHSPLWILRHNSSD